MKFLVYLITIVFSSAIYAQVGIGTITPTAELEIGSTQSGLPSLELNPQTSPVGTASGQISVIDDQLFLYDSTRGKWLSVETSIFSFGHEGGLNNTNLEYAGDIDNSGPNMPQKGTIVYVTLNSSGGNPTKGVTLNKYNSSRTFMGSYPLNLIGGKLVLPDYNVDFNKGDYFRVRVNNGGGSNVNDLSVVLWTKWRN